MYITINRLASKLASYSVIITCQHRQLTWRWQHNMAVVLNLEQAGAHWHGDSHNDGLTDPRDVIHPAMQGGIKENICCLLK